MRGSSGGQLGVWTPSSLKNHKHIGFLSNTGPDPLNNHKVATKPAFFADRHVFVWYELLCVFSSFAIIFTRKRELIALL